MLEIHWKGQQDGSVERWLALQPWNPRDPSHTVVCPLDFTHSLWPVDHLIHTIKGIYWKYTVHLELAIQKVTPLGNRWKYILGSSKVIFQNYLILHWFIQLIFLKCIPCINLLDLYESMSGSHKVQCLPSKLHTEVKSQGVLDRIKRGVLSSREWRSYFKGFCGSAGCLDMNINNSVVRCDHVFMRSKQSKYRGHQHTSFWMLGSVEKQNKFCTSLGKCV